MTDVIGGIRQRLDALRHTISSIRAKQISSTATRDAARDLVQSYFRVDRPALIATALDESVLPPLDEEMQRLLVQAQHLTTRTAYLRTLASLGALLNKVEVLSITLPDATARSASSTVDRLDQQIIETLADLCPSAAASYTQALSDLETLERASWRGTAAELREALRQALDKLAPDDEVMGQEGFKPEPGQTRPTMRQKVQFILTSRGMGKTAAQPTVEAASVVDAVVGDFVRSVYAQASGSTHGQPPTRSDALKIRSFVRTALAELLELHG
ncbi:MAG TPA: hypothetical protein VM537_20025 [Anaerolineae bacterium]|nr:hypothetical protein [Anaerolineae bacterium]